MGRRTTTRLALAAALALSAGGCDLFGIGRCDHELRHVEASATLRPPGGGAALAGRVLLAESRGGDPEFQVLSAYLQRDGAPPAAAEARVVRRDEGHEGELVAAVAIAPPVQGEISGNRDLGRDELDSDEFRDLIGDGALALEIRDAAGALLLAGPLAVTEETDWERPYCD
jgi:hypothetical protein